MMRGDQETTTKFLRNEVTDVPCQPGHRGSLEEEAPPQRAQGLPPLVVVESRRPCRSQLEGGQPPRLAGQKKYLRKGPLQ